MRKFLALLVVLSLTVFAGSAFAAISTNPAAVNVTAGSTATVSVTARTTHDGELGAISFTGPEWATFDGTSTITIAPGTSVTGSYTATVSVTESFIATSPSGAGHTVQTETSTANVAINVTAPVAPLTLTATPGNTTIMAGESTTVALTSTGGTGAKVYALSELVDGLSISGSTATFAPKAAGTYLLTFIVTDEAGRTQVAATTITVAEVFAASATLSKNPVSVDEQVTVNLIATGGIGAANFTTSTTGVALGATTNNTATATFRSAESGIFTLSFTATDGASHTAAVNVSVIVDAPAPEPEAEDVVEEVVSQDVRETITATSHTLSSDLTTEVNEDAINNTMSKNAGAAIASDDSYSDEEKALAEGVDERNEAAVDELKNAGAFPEDAESLPQEDVTVTPSSNTDFAGTVAKDNANTGRGSSAPIMGFGVSSPRDGIVKVPAPRQKPNLWGLIIRVLKAVVNVNNNRAMPGFTAAADDDDTDTTVFLDSNGNVTTTIPTSVDVNGNPRIGGFMTIATYVKANEPVDMIFSVPTEELEAAGITTETNEVEVVLPTFLGKGTNFFSTFVSSDLLTNTNYYRIGENVLTSKLNSTVTRSDWARTEEERALATTNNYTMITRLASIDATAEADTHTYIVAAVFSADKAKKDRIDTTEDGGFIFYPNGPANAAGAAEVLKVVARDDGTYGFDDLTPADIKNGVTNGYLAFSVEGGSAATKPMLAVKLLPAEVPTFAFVISKSNVTVKQGETETAELTAVNNSGDVDYFIAENGFDWITIDGNIVTFAPKTETAARTYTVTIHGCDEALATYSQDVTVTVTSAGSAPDSGDVPPTPTTSLGLSASTSELNLRLGQIETVTLTASNVLGTASYSAVADKESVGVAITDNIVMVAPTEAGEYTVTCTVVDSGRTTDNTATTSFKVVVTGGGVGSSGGGCDAGFGVLALAVLGGFIVARKK